MTLALAVQGTTVATDDGFLRFACPRCGKTVFRFHPETRGAVEAKCSRTGSTGGGGPCKWQDYVYINTLPEEMANA